MPYFFLVSMGALQSIPDELVEAAKVDGGGPLQIFRRVTLPLLLVAVSPLLIASFAFNFNNFNNIYLLTSGCPCASGRLLVGQPGRRCRAPRVPRGLQRERDLRTHQRLDLDAVLGVDGAASVRPRRG